MLRGVGAKAAWWAGALSGEDDAVAHAKGAVSVERLEPHVEAAHRHRGALAPRALGGARGQRDAQRRRARS